MALEEYLDVPLVQSRFSRVLTRGPDLQLYHTLLMKVMYLDEESKSVFDRFKSVAKPGEVVTSYPESRGLIESLVKNYMLVKEGINERGIITRAIERDLGSDSLSIMYLLPTDECNLRCRYCFLENSMPQQYQHSDMENKVMKRGIDFFGNRPIKEGEKKVLIIYGGEPLLNPDIVRDAVQYSKDNFPNIGINIVTNGTLITKDIAKLFAERDVFVGVSIDGPKEVHDKIRVFRDKRGTFESARRGYEILREEGCKHVGISLTIGSHNVNNLKENVEYLVNELKPNAFGFNFLIDTHFGKNPYAVPIEIATNKAIEAFKYLREEGIFEERMMRKIKPFIKEIMHLKDCGAAGGNQIVLSPDGKIGPCQAFLPSRKYFTQDINNPQINLDDPSLDEWKKRYPLRMKECQDCDAIGICGGGCPYQSYINTGSIFGLDERMCTHNKKFLNWLLWDLYDSQNGNSTS